MNYDPSNPLIVQGDRSILVEVDNPRYAEARDALAPFADLEKSPEHIHTYRLTPLSLWNAAAAGMTADEMVMCWLATASSPFRPTWPPIWKNWWAVMAGSFWNATAISSSWCVRIGRCWRNWPGN